MPSPATLEVLQPGLLTTVQDLGRPDAAALGVPHSGACDPLALSAANLLVGNAPGAAALEMSLLGPELRVLRPCLAALAGADFEASIAESGVRLEPGSSMLLSAGTTLRMGAAGDGARGYLALRGGIDVPLVLGSASTALTAGFGGIGGRALLPGDLIAIGDLEGMDDVSPAPRTWLGPGASSGCPAATGTVALRVVRGPHADRLGPEAWDRLIGTTWDVDPRSDRMGVRLIPSAGNARHTSTDAGGSLASLPMTWGAIQLPPGGAPICLLADHPSVGGYPVIAVVISADLPTLGQLRAPHRVAFQAIELGDAQAAFLRGQAELDEAARRLSPTTTAAAAADSGRG